MRRCALLILLVATVLPASAAKRVTVDQLDQALTALQGKPDAETARHLIDLELTQRPSQATLSRWKTDFSGPETRQALSLLVNTAAFLDLPPADIPPTPAPDRETQRHIMTLTVDYVSKTIHQLPNLFATRKTTHFEDAPQGYEKGGMVFVAAQPIHFTGTTSAGVIYRDGAEVIDSKASKGAKTGSGVQGLTTSGEFGPILVTVLIDAAHGSLGWSHWEPGESGPLAVFRYTLTREQSHYEVSYCCVADQAGSSEPKPFHQVVGYHGEMAVDPATGAVRRLTVQAELKTTDPIVRADIMVEYGPVAIGGNTYICPQRSVSISVAYAMQSSEMQAVSIGRRTSSPTMHYSPGHLQTLLNEVSFEQYHLFHANAQLMAADTASPEEHPVADTSNSVASADTSASAVAPVAAPAASQPTTAEGASASPAAENVALSAPASPSATNATEATLSAAPGAPGASAPVGVTFDVPALSASNQDRVPTFKANSEAVVVDVVVTKRDDEPVTGLQKEDFQVMEDGKPQPVDFFEEHSGAAEPVAALPPMPPNVYTNQPAAPPGDSVNVLLLDSLNTPKADQVYVHQQIVSFMKNLQPGTRLAIFTLGSRLRYVQGFTDDASLLNAAVSEKNGVKVDTTFASRTREDDAADADQIKTMEMMSGGRTAGTEAVERSQGNVAGYQANDRFTMTLDALQHLALYLSGIPGRKNLIWFSSTFPVTVFPSAKERQPTAQERTYSKELRATADLLTLSKVAIYPVGAEGMMVNHTVDAEASLDEVNKAAPMGDYTNANNSRASTIAAMGQLAADTGGEAILNTNDLNKAVARAVQNGSHYYTLVYSPTNKNIDGSYRRIEVKMNNGKYKLSYRRGYYAKEAAQPEADVASQADPLRPLLARGMPSASQLLYGVRVIPETQQPAPTAPRAGGNDKLTAPLTRYDVDFLIRWTDVDLQVTPKGTHSGQIQVGVIAYGRDGKPVNWVGFTQRMNLNPTTFAAIQRSGIPAHVEMDLPSQDVYLATGIYDWASKKAGTLEIPLNVVHAQAASASQAPAPVKQN